MIYRFLGEESINNQACYHIQCISKPQKPSAKEPLHLVRYECQFWIQKSDFLPVKYSEAIDMEINKDTMYQYNVFALDNYEFNEGESDSIFSLSGIPAYYKLKDYLPYDAPDPLPLD